MPPVAHARLSPSAAERWLSCPASVRVEAEVSTQESRYAREGTAAHALAELKASLAFDKIAGEEFSARYDQWFATYRDILDDAAHVDMERHTDAYVALLAERVAARPNSALLLEQRLDTGVPECWGTADAVIVSPRHVEVVDLKYGQGVAVDAVGNPQLRLYACGALDTYANLLGTPESVLVTVFQPRLGSVKTEELTPAELELWRAEVVLPVADVALHAENPPYGPSEAACRWCPLSGQCRAQAEFVFGLADYSQPPATLTPEEMATALDRARQIEDWLSALKEAALDRAYSGGEVIPGYKVVLTGGRRAVVDTAKALDVLHSLGFSNDEVATVKLRGIGELEKLLGRERFHALLEEPGLVARSEDKPALVPESDKRPSVTPNATAAAEFGADLIN